MTQPLGLSILNPEVGDFAAAGPLATADSIGKAKPELLSPAGDWDCARAAVENGADAIYFGLQRHNARARAHNFELNELDELVAFLHRRGVRGYVTLNTLVFSDELLDVERTIRQVAAAGVDAVIVQDLAIVEICRQVCPDLGVHASTQMTLTSAENIRFVERLGVERVILARELSMAEIKKIRARTSMPLECFVHGALCVAYSGQCLTSEALGGRSANRGECAQACRLPYDLVCDGKTENLGAVQYLLSPQDLAAIAVVPDLVALGMASLKIEGRLKTPEYVANISRHYREAIDAAVAGRPAPFNARVLEEMELSFSRGFYSGWLKGNNHKELVPGLNSSKRGVLLGEVIGNRRGRIAVQLATGVKRGDGVAFAADGPEKPQLGGRIYEIFEAGRPVADAIAGASVELAFERSLNVDGVQIGKSVWKTDDPELTSRLRKTFTGSKPLRRMPVHLAVMAQVGQPLRMECKTATGAAMKLESEQTLVAATKHPLTIELLREQFGRLGGTTYELGSLEATIVGAPMTPLSVLGALRKRMIEALDSRPDQLRSRPQAGGSIVERWRRELSPASSQHAESPKLGVMCRTIRQLAVVLEQRPDFAYVDFQDIREYHAAVAQAQAAAVPIYLATPRIQKPLEGPLFRHLAKQKSDGILVRNLAGLDFFSKLGTPVVADFSLNAANEIAAAMFVRAGAQRVTASYDLDGQQLLSMVRKLPPAWLEVVVYQHMPMFHMEHCVFCAFLSPGTDRTNCGRPCDHHEVALRDRMGMEHALKADVGCRNTLFNAVAQSAAEHVDALCSAGIGNFRIELLNESPGEIADIIEAHRGLLAGRLQARELWTTLKAIDRLGVTRGTFDPTRTVKSFDAS